MCNIPHRRHSLGAAPPVRSQLLPPLFWPVTGPFLNQLPPAAFVRQTSVQECHYRRGLAGLVHAQGTDILPWTVTPMSVRRGPLLEPSGIRVWCAHPRKRDATTAIWDTGKCHSASRGNDTILWKLDKKTRQSLRKSCQYNPKNSTWKPYDNQRRDCFHGCLSGIGASLSYYRSVLICRWWLRSFGPRTFHVEKQFEIL